MYIWLLLAVSSAFSGFGAPRLRYCYKVDPFNDLSPITSSQASVLSKMWMRQLLHKLPNGPDEKDTKGTNYIFSDINALEQYISINRDNNHTYFAWHPKPKKGHPEPLFIACCKNENLIIHVDYIIQNPRWSPDKVSSKELKRSLSYIPKNLKVQDIDTVSFERLKETQPRYYMSWFIEKFTSLDTTT